MHKMPACVSLLFHGVLWTICQAADGPIVIAAGDWSKPVADNRGFAVRGRLVIAEKEKNRDQRSVAVYVELQDASEHVGSTMQIYCDLGRKDFRPEYKGGLHCEMRNKDGKLIPAMGYPFGGAVPGSLWMTLPSDGTIRLRASPFGVRRERAIAITSDLSSLWIIGEDDPSEHFLSGTFTVDPAPDQKP